MASNDKQDRDKTRGKDRRSTSSRPQTSGTAGPRPGSKTTFDDLRVVLDDRLDRLSSELAQTVQSHVRQALKADIRQAIEAEVRAEITKEVRREMAERLDASVNDHEQLDPVRILNDFVRRTTELLSNSPQAAGDSLTQRELVEGLRQAVLDAFSNRRLHLAHLAELDSHLKANTNLEDIELLVDEWFMVTGLRRVITPTEGPECFVPVNSAVDGPYLALVRPAYVDTATQKIVRSGQIRHTNDPTSAIYDDSSAGGK
ncbi:hypothetical protein AB0K48_43970 [Nonomuraea sp. NPDC055795]